MIPRIARLVAVLAGAALAFLWVRLVFFAGDGAAAGAGPPAWLAVGVFGGLALAAVVAAVRGAPLVLAVVGLVSFFPVGLYLLLVPSVFRLVGVLDLVLVAAAWVLWSRDRGEDPGPEPTGVR